MSDDLARLGDDIRRRRERVGLSQEKLAELARVGRSTIQKIERREGGVRHGYLIRVLDALAETERADARSGAVLNDTLAAIARDPNLDEDARAHFHNQYLLLVGLSELRRRQPRLTDDEAVAEAERLRPGLIREVLADNGPSATDPDGDPNAATDGDPLTQSGENDRTG